MELIFCGDVRIFILNSATFLFVRKKKSDRQTEKQTQISELIVYRGFQELPGNFDAPISGVQRVHIRGGGLFGNGGFYSRCMIFKMIF